MCGTTFENKTIQPGMHDEPLYQDTVAQQAPLLPARPPSANHRHLDENTYEEAERNRGLHPTVVFFDDAGEPEEP